MSRADLFVYLALAAAWLVIAAWALRIGRKADRLQARIDGAAGAGPGESDAS